MAALKRIWVCTLKTVSNLDPIYHLTVIPIFTSRNDVVAKEIFLHLSVILFTGGVSASVHAGIPPRADTPRSRPPRSRHPPEADTPLGADTPWEQTPLDQTPSPESRVDTPRADTPQSRHRPGSRHHPGSRHPPLEQTPPHSRHLPGSRHPPWKADSGIWSMSGRYASYCSILVPPQVFQLLCSCAIFRNFDQINNFSIFFQLLANAFSTCY